MNIIVTDYAALRQEPDISILDQVAFEAAETCRIPAERTASAERERRVDRVVKQPCLTQDHATLYRALREDAPRLADAGQRNHRFLGGYGRLPQTTPPDL